VSLDTFKWLVNWGGKEITIYNRILPGWVSDFRTTTQNARPMWRGEEPIVRAPIPEGFSITPAMDYDKIPEGGTLVSKIKELRDRLEQEMREKHRLGREAAGKGRLEQENMEMQKALEEIAEALEE